MKHHVNISYCGMSERNVYHLHLPELKAFPEDLALASANFILFLALDGRAADDETLSRFSRKALEQGARFLCVWGPDCERVHDLFDKEAWSFVKEETRETMLLTLWQSNESLAEALWYAVHTAEPAEAYRTACNSLLVLTVGKPGWESMVDNWLSDPGQLEKEVFRSGG